MTYQQIKVKLTEEENLMDIKQFKKFILRYSLFCIGVNGLIGLAALITIGFNLALLLSIVCLAGYIFGLDYLVEEHKLLIKVTKYIRFWWVVYIMIVILYLVFKYFLFI